MTTVTMARRVWRCCVVVVLFLLFLCLPSTLSFPPLPDMSPSDVGAWLSSLSLQQYAAAFTSHGIDGGALSTLSAAELQTLGISALGHRKKILKAINDLKTQDTLPTPSTPSAPHTAAVTGAGTVEPLSSSDVICEMAADGTSSCENKLYLGVRTASEYTADADNWHEEPYPHPYDTQRCNIDRVAIDRLTEQQFLTQYYLRKPLILTPTPITAQTTLRVRAAWSRQSTLRQLSKLPVNLGTPHSLTAFGDGVVSSTLGQYIVDLRNASVDRISADHYLFDRRGFFKQAAVLLETYQPHPLFHWHTTNAQYGTSDGMTYALGPTGSGINFHYHKDGWNEVLFGRKRWFLYPPTVGAPPGGYNQFEPALRWYEETYDTLGEDELPYECVQYPGEVFYVPEDWSALQPDSNSTGCTRSPANCALVSLLTLCLWMSTAGCVCRYHATINIGETVAVVGQASRPAEGTMMDHVYKGLETGDQGDRKRSIAHFQRALDVAPNHPQVYNYLGNHYKSHDELRTAASFYEKAVTSNPKYSMAWLSLGQTLTALQQYEEAYAALRRSYALNSEYHETALELGNVCYFMNRLDEAADWLEQAVALGKEDKRTNAFINLCSMYVALDRPDYCITLAESRLVTYPKEWYVWTVYAQALGVVGRRGEARGVLRDVMLRNGGQFAPAEGVWQRMDEEDEADLKKRGIAPGSEADDKEREVGMDEQLRGLKERQESAAETGERSEPLAKKPKEKVKVQVTVESSRSTRPARPSRAAHSPTIPRISSPPRYAETTISTAGLARELKLVTSYDLSALFPSSVARLSLQPALTTYPPLLNDPYPPLFVGGTATQTSQREAECKRYMESRVISAPFAVQVWNTWMKATGGRLFGELQLHAITARQQQPRDGSSVAVRPGGESEEDVVFVSWDGMVFTPSHFFSYERFCVAGHYCILEEMQSLQLLQLSGTSEPKPALAIPSLSVFTGAVFAAQASRVANPKDYGLGIKVDHVAKNMAQFRSRMKDDSVVRHNAVVWELPLGDTLPEFIEERVKGECPAGRLERHHYPALLVLDQFMSGVNYAHFVTEILPKLALLTSSTSHAHLLSDAYLVLTYQPFIPEVLRALNVSETSVIWTHPCVLLSADEVYQFTPLPLDMPTKETIRSIRRAFGLKAERGSRRHVYDGSEEERRKMGEGTQAAEKQRLLNSTEPILLSLFRPYPLTRSISNSDAVQSVLTAAFPSLPVVTFDPSYYTFNEAITLFSRAAAVIGVIGAGFANLAFAPLDPPPAILQLVPTLTHHRIPCGVTPWWHYAEVLGMSSRYMTIEGMGFDEVGWEVPVEQLKRWIKQHKELAVL